MTVEAKSIESVVTHWWGRLKERPGDRADLRRAHTISDVIFCPAFHALKRAVVANVANGHQVNLERLAAVAGVLAWVKKDSKVKDSKVKLGAELGRPLAGKATLSGLRFRRLLQRTDADELLIGFRRAVRHLGEEANVGELASTLIFWGDCRRRELAVDYYDAAPAAEA